MRTPFDPIRSAITDADAAAEQVGSSSNSIDQRRTASRHASHVLSDALPMRSQAREANSLSAGDDGASTASLNQRFAAVDLQALAKAAVRAARHESATQRSDSATVDFESDFGGASSSSRAASLHTERTTRAMPLANMLIGGRSGSGGALGESRDGRKPKRAAEQFDSRTEPAAKLPKITFRLPLNADALAQLNNEQEGRHTPLPALALGALPSAEEIMNFHNVPLPQRLEHFMQLAAKVAAGLSKAAGLSDTTKEAMASAVLTLAGQTRYLDHGVKSQDGLERYSEHADQRRPAWRTIMTLAKRLPKLDGESEAHFHAEYTRVRSEVLGSTNLRLNPTFGAEPVTDATRLRTFGTIEPPSSVPAELSEPGEAATRPDIRR